MKKFFVALSSLLVACTSGYSTGLPDAGTPDASTLDAANADSTVQDSGPAQDASVVDSAVDAEVPAVCGDGIINGLDQCDGSDLGGTTCQDLGYIHGTLLCNASCSFDVSGCNNDTVCGDGVAEGNEECDQNDFRGLWCGDIPGFVAGQLVCTASCTISTSLCLESVCGDEIATVPQEQCDGPDIAGVTCQDLGFDFGTLMCMNDCTYDTRLCEMNPFCGDGVVDPGEECDEGGNQGSGVVDDVVCEDFGLQSKPNGMGGTYSEITCWQCQYDTSDCTNCGNGIKEWGEACDGTDFGTAHCLYGGTLACTAACTVDYSGCNSGE